MSLPPELHKYISDGMSVIDVFNLGHTCKHLASIHTEKGLRDRIRDDPSEGAQLLLWAVENMKGMDTDKEKKRLFRRILEMVKPRDRYLLASPVPRKTLNLLSKGILGLDSTAQRIEGTRYPLIKYFIEDEEKIRQHHGKAPTAVVPTGTTVFNPFQVLADLTRRPSYTWTPLHAAVMEGNREAVELLIQEGADINSLASGVCNCCIPEHVGGSLEELRIWKSSSRRPRRESPATYHLGVTPLHVATCTDQTELAIWLIEKGAGLNVAVKVKGCEESGLRNNDMLYSRRSSSNVLHEAATMGNRELTRYVLTRHKDAARRLINRPCLGEYTPLERAAAGGHVRTVGPLLITAGAKIKSAGNRVDALSMCCLDGRIEDAEALLDLIRLWKKRATLRQSTGLALKAACLRVHPRRFVRHLDERRSMIMQVNGNIQLPLAPNCSEFVDVTRYTDIPDKGQLIPLIGRLLELCDKSVHIQADLPRRTPTIRQEAVAVMTPLMNACNSWFHEAADKILETGVGLGEIVNAKAHPLGTALDDDNRPWRSVLDNEDLLKTISALRVCYQELPANLKRAMIVEAFENAAERKAGQNEECIVRLEEVVKLEELPYVDILGIASRIFDPFGPDKPAMDIVLDSFARKKAKDTARSDEVRDTALLFLREMQKAGFEEQSLYLTDKFMWL